LTLKTKYLVTWKNILSCVHGQQCGWQITMGELFYERWQQIFLCEN
jgi:hypothetical protein